MSGMCYGVNQFIGVGRFRILGGGGGGGGGGGARGAKSPSRHMTS